MKSKQPIIVALVAGAIFVIAIALYLGQATEEPLTTTEPVATEEAVEATTETNVVSVVEAMEEIPDFKSYTNVKQKKHDFFNFMLPLVRRANASVARDREYVQALAGQQSLSKPETARLLDLMKQYRLEASETPADQLDALLVKIDTVPASLILAQSANESAWGTSRFATEANNFFGIWCFSRGCGLTPKDRDDGLSHEVARFDSVQHGVGRYIHTLNSHPAYEQLRTIRLEQRQNGKDLSGIELAEGLVKYSERGAEYVEEIQSMISYNKLQQYNLATSESSAVLLSE